MLPDGTLDRPDDGLSAARARRDLLLAHAHAPRGVADDFLARGDVGLAMWF
jgi:hypothetical protein